MNKNYTLLLFLLFSTATLFAQIWEPCNLAQNSNNTNGTAVCVHNGKLYATNNSSGLQVSSDLGATWTQVNASIVAPGVDLYSTSDRLYALLHNSGCTNIQYSTDDGLTFQEDTAGLPSCFANTILIPSSGGISWDNKFMLSVAGPDWEFFRNTASSEWVDASYFDANDCSEFFVKNDTCWAATNGATSNGVAWSVDGTNWTSPASTGIAPYYVPTHIGWSNNRLIMMGMDVGAGNDGVDTILKYSDDYGLSFQDHNIKSFLMHPSQSTLDIFFAYDRLYFTLENDLFGSRPDLMFSEDGGETFTMDTAGFPAGENTIFEIKDMAFLDGYAFAQVNAGDLFRQKIFTVGTEDIGVKKSSVRVFPNPAETEIQIAGADNLMAFRITDLTGKLLVVGNKSNVDISSLNAGLYFIHVLSENEESTHLFIKK